MKEIVAYAILIMGVIAWLLLIASVFVYLIDKLQLIYIDWQWKRSVKKELNHAQN